jgi:hypothetical protein
MNELANSVFRPNITATPNSVPTANSLNRSLAILANNNSATGNGILNYIIWYSIVPLL